MQYTHLRVDYTFDRRIATVTLNRPEVHNALNNQLIQDLADAFTMLGTQEQLHGIVLAAEGRSFSAGADVQMMRASIQLSEEANRQDALRLADMLQTIYACPCPVVARVHGHAIGGGAGLVAMADIAIAAEGARFAFSEVKLGIAPAVISPYVLRKIGAGQARALFVTGERFNAARAYDIGLVHAVVTAEQLDGQVAEVINELLSGAPQALRACKLLATQVGQMDAKTARHYTAETIARLRVSPEGQEGLNAYLEKRTPAWRQAEDV